MAQLCGLFANRAWPDCATTRRIFDWPGDLTPAGQSVPLRLAGALHALRLQGRALADVYPPNQVDDDTLWQHVCDTILQQQTFIMHWLDSAPQTNEVRRSAAIIAAAHVVAERFDLPMRTSELGASGGLNMMWDRYGLQCGDTLLGPQDVLTLSPDWTGPPPPSHRPRVVSRGGVDLNPLDPTQPQDALRLQAYLWPDQPTRLARTKSAIGLATARPDQGDAIDWLTPRLQHQTGVTHLIYHTVAWQYFPEQARQNGTALIEQAGAAATNDAPLAWFSMENDGAMKGAALTLRLWPGNETLNLGRADFHGRWIKWNGA
jgi:hypothetical protein